MAQALKQKEYPPNVLLIQGSFVHQSAIDRTGGFLDVGRKRGLNITEVQGEWKKDRAQELTATHFSRRDPEYGGIFANNDDMALGAVNAIQNLGEMYAKKWPIIIGFDATKVALDAIGKGEMHATLEQEAKKMGYEGVMAAVKALKNDSSLKEENWLEVNLVPPR